MSPIRAHSKSRFAGRSLSVGRLVFSVAAASLVSAAVAVSAVLPAFQPPVDGAPVDSRWFAGYYDVTLESGEQLARSPLGDSAGGAVLAFVVAAADDECTPTWGKAYSLDQAAQLFELDRRVERMQREGRPLAVSFGGVINTELASACSNATELTASYRTVMDRYGIDVMDLDIEGEMLTDTDASLRRAQSVAALQAERREAGGSLDVWLTLPVAPYGLTPDGLLQVEGMLDERVDLTGVNVMTMNYGTDGTAAPMSSLSIDALQATASQLTAIWKERELPLPEGGVWSLLGATPMIGQNDVAGEVFTTDDARAFNEFASTKGVARLSMWSLNRDQTCGSNYPNLTVVATSCSGIEQAGESFTTILTEGYEGTPSGRPAATTHEEVVSDDPTTSPYPVWSSRTYYSAGVKVVWHGSVYASKWWNEDGPTPDDPSLDAEGSAWTYLGPVLASDVPFALPQLEPGTYPEWSEKTLYDQGDRVLFEGTGYEARWWSQAKDPSLSVLDRDYSPWKLITDG
ncbi:chitinase (glycosyl hydrolase family 18) [Glaciihabitans tibetensis]|uniref:Chitinase (Glycosyl hydrolase family 18) n=1 Tax=Glaciihabitans tibetensis TaxID=1266600 RepID=A0A2T0VAA3_9MICO|nr:chitinase [Glaciihabitans tibetensis]PRY67081.1 chitinase (glycosyl hydrolase family 18) [Glaciihabitans tibetensis]